MSSINLKFSSYNIVIKLRPTPTANAIKSILPCKSIIKTWGEEIYFEMPIQKNLSLDNDISDKDDGFVPQEHLLTPKKFFELRRTTKKVYVFDLRNAEEFEKSHLPGAHNLVYEHFEDSIYQMPFTGEIMLYGGNQPASFKAAEILYDFGFETYYFTDSYEALYEGMDASFLDISDEAKNNILDKLDPKAGKTQGIEIIVEPKSDRKANYSIQFVDLSDTASEKISIDFEN